MQKPPVVNPHLPIRPRHDPETGDLLMFATMPQASLHQRYVVTHPWNMMVQARLYRAVRSGEWVNHAPIEEIHPWIFYDRPDVSKKMMGSTVIRTVLYNPRRLKGVTKDNDKARVLYSFNNLKELEYGLEWMICTWLRKFLNDDVARRAVDRIHGPEAMDRELEVLAFTEEQEYRALYEESYPSTRFTDPDWDKLMNGFNELDHYTNMPGRVRPRPGPPLKSYQIKTL